MMGDVKTMGFFSPTKNGTSTHFANYYQQNISSSLLLPAIFFSKQQMFVDLQSWIYMKLSHFFRQHQP